MRGTQAPSNLNIAKFRIFNNNNSKAGDRHVHMHAFSTIAHALLHSQDANAFSCVVVTDTGKMFGKFLGLVTSREVDFENDHMKTLSEVMTK